MRKVVTVVGARPQFIKAAVVSQAIKGHPDLEEVMVHTGQHFDPNMSEVFFDELGIDPPKYNLGIGGGTHGQNTGRMIEKIEEVLILEKPQWLLIYGDTDSTLAGAIAAAKLHVPVAHVEAGLRSFNRQMPEEINRILADHTSALLFIPTNQAGVQLQKEGIPPEKVIFSGDVMYDATKYFTGRAAEKSGIFEKHRLTAKSYILMTLHRAENVDDRDRLTAIFEALKAIDTTIIFPLHPRTAKRLETFGIELGKNILTIDPVGYLDMLVLEKNALCIITDSGGVQKEAYFNQVPCITLREETEWVELVACGANELVKADSRLIVGAIERARLVGPEKFGNKLYGEGDASGIIANSLANAIV